MRILIASLALAFSVGCGGTLESEPVSAGPAELGHLPVPAMAHGARHAARLFYSYRPSDDGDGRRPLFVFMNGGPGFATSMGLVSWGIGPSTLKQGAEDPAANPASWTRFGNLLFLDERHAGFSYGLKPAVDEGSCSMLDDAADHLLAVLEFLAAHPHLKHTRVVLVGESYGGMRAVAMLKLLREPALAPTDELRDALRTHGDDAARAAQFAEAVLIQPLLLGDVQYRMQTALLRDDPLLGKVPKDHSGHDVRRTLAEMTALDEQTLRAFGRPESRASLLGGRAEEISTLGPAARHDAFRHVQTWNLDAEDLPDRDLAARLGALGVGDRYFSPMAVSCVSILGPEATQPWFLELLPTTRFFMTNARYDAAIHTPAVVEAMRSFGLTVDTPDGSIVVHLPERVAQGIPAIAATIRFPTYESGHAVAVSAPNELATDVSAWLAASASP